MLRLLLLILPIALIDGISPVRIGTMVVLLGGRRPWIRACSFMAGTVVSYFLLGVIPRHRLTDVSRDGVVDGDVRKAWNPRR